MAWAPVFHVLLEELDTGGWAALEAGDPELENGRYKPWKRGRGPTARGTSYNSCGSHRLGPLFNTGAPGRRRLRTVGARDLRASRSRFTQALGPCPPRQSRRSALAGSKTRLRDSQPEVAQVRSQRRMSSHLPLLARYSRVSTPASYKKPAADHWPRRRPSTRGREMWTPAASRSTTAELRVQPASCMSCASQPSHVALVSGDHKEPGDSRILQF
ncbi:hypothetical protein CPLU01_01223 [Colletotrichum plurivorum]|uniref:Uncharacterized protein n=1 Tax=Colletotrichum plurivorum TaxID=2175906 RepID=A0A8H6NPL1_9PEZI|nr:hypothetical protein CPLU01_01223 [Colletotrichum plurivorum]